MVSLALENVDLLLLLRFNGQKKPETGDKLICVSQNSRERGNKNSERVTTVDGKQFLTT